MKKNPDFILVGVIILLLIFGILILSSVSASLSQEKFGTTFYFLNHQILFGIIPGLILAILAYLIPLNFLRKWAPLLLLINLILLVMVFLPKIGMGLKGAARWLSIGGITFQPSEFLKLTFILYLASWLASRPPPKFSGKVKISRQQGSKRVFLHQILVGGSQTFIAFLIAIGLVSLLLIFQPDIGTLGIIALIAILLYFSAGTPLWHSILIILMAIAGLFSLIKLASYRADRLLVFLKPETDPLGIGFQIKQALIAVGSGGIFGLGLGMSSQKFGFLPHPMSDSIFAILSEETGFLGSTILIFLFLIFLWRGVKISKESKYQFAKLAALGISSWIVLQAFVNIGSMIGVLPLTGIPLPFISYGGSALVAELIGVGILLNISKTAI